MHSGTEWLRKIHADQDHYAGVLSAGARRIVHFHPGRERWNIFELRSFLGIVSPDLLGSCTTDATGRDVVLSGFFSSTRIFPHQHPDAEQLARADRALERMGVAHLANRAVAHMSSGEAKRTLIARALVHDPRTLLFDEPSNALDIAAQLQLRATMRELAQSGIAILLVTHHVSEIIPEIERVILLRDGRIVADGAKASVLTSEKMSALFGVPLQIDEPGRLLSHSGMSLRRERSFRTTLQCYPRLVAFGASLEFNQHIVEQARGSELDGEQRVRRAAQARYGLEMFRASTISA